MKHSFRNWQTIVFIFVIVGIMALALSGYLNILISRITSPLLGAQSWLSTRYNALVEFITIPKDSASLIQQNTNLKAQIALLENQVIELEQQLNKTEVLSSLLDFARTSPENSYVAAMVIGRDPSPFLHYVIIDHGSDFGIQHGMPVVSQQGLVGRIDAVTSNAARVQLITDPSSSVNVLLRNAETDGTISGTLTGDVELTINSTDIKISPGDLVITSGLGGNYPTNITVGQLTSIHTQPGDLFQTGIIQPAVDLNMLQAVLVITNFTSVDISPLIPTPIP